MRNLLNGKKDFNRKNDRNFECSVDEFDSIDWGRPHMRIQLIFIVKLILFNLLGFQNICYATQKNILYDQSIKFPENLANSIFYFVPDLGGGRCTGTLVKKDLILTAAHCLIDITRQFPDPNRKISIYNRIGQQVSSSGTLSIHNEFIFGKNYIRPDIGYIHVNPSDFEKYTPLSVAENVSIDEDVIGFGYGVPLIKILNQTIPRWGRLYVYFAKVDKQAIANRGIWGSIFNIKMPEILFSLNFKNQDGFVPGDSGGPVIRLKDFSVVGVSSADGDGIGGLFSKSVNFSNENFFIFDDTSENLRYEIKPYLEE